ncbi:nucleotide-binding oligomerization domain-containing protein 1 isoform X1 [Chrysemys picta bellii]|uniref:nucleotide-binding oligomerization domain-containing protein 1 isoform X1 n=1 Tax=Chrysemys picta bellii TaxID=8478 RepID=UPI0032B13442
MLRPQRPVWPAGASCGCAVQPARAAPARSETSSSGHPQISLAFNGITPEGGKSIAEALKHNNTVKIFWLTKNAIDDDAAESFAEMLRVNKKLAHLWLIQNQITAKGAKYLSEALQENTTIKEICLNGNLINQEEAKAFANEERIICF